MTSMIIKKLTSAEATAESIRAMILDGKLQPGEPLRQDTLSSELGVSRTPIRQAFQILADDGLVIIEGFKGARVMEVNMPVVRDLFDMRIQLEPLALKSSFDKITKVDLAKAEMVLDQVSEATKPAELSNLNWQFHELLYNPSNRPVLMDTIRRLNMTTAYASVIARSITERAEESHKEHLEILEACRQKDETRALRILKQHLKEAFKEVSSILSIAS